MSKVTYILGRRGYIIIKRNNTDISSFYDKEVVPMNAQASQNTTCYILLNIHQQCEQCFQVVRLIAINRPGRSPVHDQQHRLDYVPWSSGRPISRRLIAISWAISLWGRSEC
jgi:hypothetical protein